MLHLQTPPAASLAVADAARSSVVELASAHARLAAADDSLIETQVAIARIPAPTGRESARAAWFADALRRRGARSVMSDQAGNVIARFEGTTDDAPVVVLSHLDTVFAPETPCEIRRDGTRLVGPGVNDNARGLAAALAIAGELAGGGIVTRRPVVIVATTGEEGAGDLRGCKHLFATQPLAAAAIALDGAGDDRIVNRALGSRRLRIGFDGPGGHSWAAFGIVNAAHAAAICAARVARLPLPSNPRATATVGRIGGGLSVNSIPAHAWLEVDVRSGDHATLERLERDVRRAVEAAVNEENERRTPGTAPLSASVERFGDRPSGETPADHPLVQLAASITTELGSRPRLAIASTDANVPMSLGIPAIAIGAGGVGGEAHTDQEWFENVEGPRGVARALAIIVAAANL